MAKRPTGGTDKDTDATEPQGPGAEPQTDITQTGVTPEGETVSGDTDVGDEGLAPEDRRGLPGLGMPSDADDAEAEGVADPGTGGMAASHDMPHGDGGEALGDPDRSLIASEARDVEAGDDDPTYGVAPSGSGHTDHTDPADAQGDDDGGPSFASRALWVLLLLLVGAGVALWAAPRLAPMLPSGLAPVAAWLTPGAAGNEERTVALETRLQDTEARIAELGAERPVDERVEAMLNDGQARIDAEIADLRTEIGQVDGAETRQSIDRLEAAIEGQIAEVGTLKEQIETAGATGGTADEVAASVDVYRAELEGLRAEVSTLSDDVSALDAKIDDVAASAEQRVEAAETRATEVEEEATATVSQAELRSDFAQIRAAISNGAPFEDALMRLEEAPDVEVPDGLSAAAASGVKDMNTLRESFGGTAHSAIRSSVQASAGEGILARSQAFLGSQFASRSLSPQEGNAPDAVLSRMEDALRQGDLDAALSEAESLPPEAQEAMSEWLADARLRAGAEDGLAALSADLPATN